MAKSAASSDSAKRLTTAWASNQSCNSNGSDRVRPDSVTEIATYQQLKQELVNTAAQDRKNRQDAAVHCTYSECMTIHWVRACAGALIAEITQIAAAFGCVAIYSYLINPGQPMATYEAHAQTSGPWVSILAGSANLSDGASECPPAPECDRHLSARGRFRFRTHNASACTKTATATPRRRQTNYLRARA